jgi:hypothetical protein
MASIALESQSLGGFQLLDARHERKFVRDPSMIPMQPQPNMVLR